MKSGIAENLRDPDVQNYSLRCDECGSELYNSSEAISQGVDTDASIMKMATLSHKDTHSHDSYTLVKEEIEVKVTIDAQ